MIWWALGILVLAPIITDRMQSHGWYKTAVAVEWAGALVIAALFIIWIAS